MTLPTAAVAGGLLGILLVVGAGPAFRSGAPLLVGFGVLGVGVLLGLLGAIAGIAALVVGFRRGLPLSPATVTGVILGLIAFGVPFQRVWSARSLPAIHDISTDLTAPPTFQAVVPLRAAAPNSLTINPADAPKQRAAYPDLAPLLLDKPPGDVFDRAVDAARDMDWEIVSADRAAGRIEGTATTRWFGFKDDIVVRLAPTATGTRVDVRSVSRIGVGDLGTNANRIRDYLARLR